MRGKLIELVFMGAVQVCASVGAFLVKYALQIWLGVIALLLAVDIAQGWRRNGCQHQPSPPPVCATVPADGDGCRCRCRCRCDCGCGCGCRCRCNCNCNCCR